MKSALFWFQLYDKINQQKLTPPKDLPDEDASQIAQEILEWIEDSPIGLTPEMEELHTLLSKPHFRSLLQAHDVVAHEIYGDAAIQVTPPPVAVTPTCSIPYANTNGSIGGTDVRRLRYDSGAASPDGVLDEHITRIRLVQFQKNTDEPMGITLKVDEEGRCIVARIMHGGMIHRQATLHVGDEIIEINGISVANQSVDSLQRLLREARGSVTFKIVPSYRSVPPLVPQAQPQSEYYHRTLNHVAPSAMYIRTMFNYDPLDDDMIPCTQAGISFRIGQILQVINRDDQNWWQVRKLPDGPTGLVPSPELQEWRITQIALENAKNTDSMNCSIFRKKKNKEKYLAKRALADEMDMACYEEVMKVPSFRRNTLVLLGAHGVGRRHIKNTLIGSNPDKYAYPIPHTTRPQRRGEETGHHYYFCEQDEMLRDIATNQYLEYGSHEGAMYGTKLETIRRIIAEGKMAILDVEPQALKMLRCPEYTPYVVFIAAPPLGTIHDVDGSLERLNRESNQLANTFGRWFDLTIVNNDIEETISSLSEAVENIHLQEQWVPVNWVYR